MANSKVFIGSQVVAFSIIHFFGKIEFDYFVTLFVLLSGVNMILGGFALLSNGEKKHDE
jgi:hypothetical protein